MRLYCSSAMSHRKGHNHKEFHYQAEVLREYGYDVVNPAALDEGEDTTGWKHSDYLKRDIRHLLDCDGVAVFGSWQLSVGAKAEVALAEALRIPVLTVEEWCYDYSSEGVTP